MRLTNNKDINTLLTQYQKIGWEIEVSGRKGMIKMRPPKALREANPEMVGFVAVHRTPSDVRAAANLKAQIQRLCSDHPEIPRVTTTKEEVVAAEKAKWVLFCRTCGPSGPEFTNKQERDAHEQDHVAEAVTTTVATVAEELVSELISPQPPTGGRKGGFGKVTRTCPVCSAKCDTRVFPKHIKAAHPEFWTRVHAEWLTMDGLENAANLSWNARPLQAASADTNQLAALLKISEGVSDTIRGMLP